MFPNRKLFQKVPLCQTFGIRKWSERD